MSLRESVRWGFCARAVAAGGIGALAVPALLSATAYASSTTPTSPTKGKITVLQDQWGDSTSDDVSKDVYGTYRGDKDPGSLFTLTQAIGARGAWGQRDALGRAVTGQGVTVALLDSGVAPVAGLDGAGKVVNGPDLSLENNSSALHALDTFGHGTHLGAIIGAADPVNRDPKTGEPTGTTAAQQLGVAPDARLLALKLASSDGSTDVSQVIAALDWVTQHKDDNGLNVRVVNLSFGTDSLQPYQVDPLAAAAENAWHHGIVVVVSGGNEGALAGGLTDPAIDPYVIAVGASDPQQKTGGWSKPVVADFSNGGTDARHVDLLAPGRSITSLRDRGSFVDVNHPEGLVAGDASGRLFRGSGTSQAAAVVSGAAALLTQADPDLTPDQVKAALVGSAHALTGVPVTQQGAGELDVTGALTLGHAIATVKPGQARLAMLAATTQTFPQGAGTGTLDGARGGTSLVDPVNGVALAGEVDVLGQPFNAARWAASSAHGNAWNGGVWNGALWSGPAWVLGTGSSLRWASADWSGNRWSGIRWSDASWDGIRWSGIRWSGASWDGIRWSGIRWSGVRWSGSEWR